VGDNVGVGVGVFVIIIVGVGELAGEDGEGEGSDIDAVGDWIADNDEDDDDNNEDDDEPFDEFWPLLNKLQLSNNVFTNRKENKMHMLFFISAPLPGIFIDVFVFSGSETGMLFKNFIEIFYIIKSDHF